MRTRRERRRAEKRMNFFKGAGILIGSIATLAAMTVWFERADCNTGRQGLRFINECIASDDCSLTMHEQRLKKVYGRMIIHNCKED